MELKLKKKTRGKVRKALADGQKVRATVTVEASDATVAAVHALGSEVSSPFQSLAFLALSVIPSLKITDRGLVDVDRFELVPLAADVAVPAP